MANHIRSVKFKWYDRSTNFDYMKYLLICPVSKRFSAVLR